MQANWSLILNIILLIGVVVAIGRLMKAKRQNMPVITNQPMLNNPVEMKPFDDIIAVRKVTVDSPAAMPKIDSAKESPVKINPIKQEEELSSAPSPKGKPSQSLMIFLQAKENRQLAGYELLQTILAAGFRFGEGQLFHRHQLANGQGPVLCSLAAATATGMFDLQNIGAFSVRGLCLFMQSSGNTTTDAERLDAMLEAAKLLSEGLDTRLLDFQQKPLNEENIRRYYQALNIPAIEHMDL